MYRLVEKIQKTLETTTTANIAYLPSGFVPVSQALARLAKHKKKWKIQILDSKDEYVVRLEDALTINVKKKDWADFMKRLKNKVVMTDNFEVDLGGYIREAKEKTMEQLFRELDGVLHRMLIEHPISSLERNIEAWRTFFGVRVYRTKNTLIEYENLEINFSNLLRKLEVAYKDDRGSIEMLISAVKEKKPLNVFEVFDDYDYLYGTVIESFYGGVALRYQALITMTWTIDESVFIGDADVVDQMEGYPTVRVQGDVMYPKGEMFNPKMFKVLRDEIKLTK